MDHSSLKCNFINTEIDTDLGKGNYSSIKEKIHNKKLFYDKTRENTLSSCKIDDIESYPFQFLDQFKIFENIIQYNKKGESNYNDCNLDFLISYDKNTKNNDYNISNIISHDTFEFVCKTYEKKNEPIKIRKFTKNRNNDLNNIFSIFSDCVKDKTGEQIKNNLFFIIDSADIILKELKNNMTIQEKEDYIIHVLHNAASLSDSPQKMNPLSSFYKEKNPQQKEELFIASWLLCDNIIIDENDSLLMSSFKIETQFFPNFSYTFQNWKDKDNKLIYNTLKPTKDNNNYFTNKWIKQKGKINKKNINNDLSLYLQKKRFGDHLQIWFAKNLYKYMLKIKNNPDIDNTNRFVLLNHNSEENIVDWRPTEKDLKNNEYFMENLKNKINKNTFFLTSDLAALSYSIFQKINTIFYYKSPINNEMCILSFTF